MERINLPPGLTRLPHRRGKRTESNPHRVVDAAWAWAGGGPDADEGGKCASPAESCVADPCRPAASPFGFRNPAAGAPGHPIRLQVGAGHAPFAGNDGDPRARGRPGGTRRMPCRAAHCRVRTPPPDPFDPERPEAYLVRMERRRLPVGIQTLGNIRARNCYYVDKTPHVQRLVEEGSHYFLSRPRRFGKSLLVDTLKELFAGNGELFRGLAIHGEWDWTVKHPVVRISFGSGNFLDPDGIREDVSDQLETIAAQADVDIGQSEPSIRFRRLVRALRRKAGRSVVVLVDEYDKPILDALAEPETARANRNFLRGFYGVIKDCDEHIRFCFLTGVSKFSKAGLFSGLNNLEDITLDPAYGTICGYTDDDLDTVFAPELEGLDRDEVRRRYNGYNWLGEGKVYNPFDILRLFRRGRFGNYWFETGTPTFLVETLLREDMPTPALDRMTAERGPAVGLRRGAHIDGGAAVPDRLPDDHRRGGPERAAALPSRLPEPRGAPEPRRGPARSFCCRRPCAGKPRTCRCANGWRRTTSRGSGSCSGACSRPSRTSGT